MPLAIAFYERRVIHGHGWAPQLHGWPSVENDKVCVCGVVGWVVAAVGDLCPVHLWDVWWEVWWRPHLDHPAGGTQATDPPRYKTQGEQASLYEIMIELNNYSEDVCIRSLVYCFNVVYLSFYFTKCSLKATILCKQQQEKLNPPLLAGRLGKGTREWYPHLCVWVAGEGGKGMISASLFLGFLKGLGKGTNQWYPHLCIFPHPTSHPHPTPLTSPQAPHSVSVEMIDKIL